MGDGAKRVGRVTKASAEDARVRRAACLFCILAAILLPAFSAAAQTIPPVPAASLADGEGPLGESAPAVLHGIASLSRHRVSSPIFWAAADYAGPAAFLANGLYRQMLRTPFLDSALVFDEHFSIPDGAAADRGIYAIDFFFLGSPSEPRLGRLFILDTSLGSLGGSMDMAFSAKMKSMTRRLGVGPTDLRTSYDLLGANIAQGVDIAAWETADRIVFLTMAANAFDGTVSDAQVVSVDRSLWNEYIGLAASGSQDGGRGLGRAP